MAVYRMTRYPRSVRLRDETELTLRPMERTDADALLDFFKAVPAEDRFFLKDDVASPEVVQAFAEHLDYDRALPMLGLADGRIVADALLIRHRGGFQRHKAEIRVVVHPDYRRKGLGVLLMHELTDIAWDAELDEVEFSMIRDVQDDAIAAAKFVGAFEVGVASEYARDPHGLLHDLVFMRIPLGKWWQWSQF